MERRVTQFGFLSFLLWLMLASEMLMMGVSGRECRSKSEKFKGMCFSNTNCGTVCKTEDFEGGRCKGWRRRCFCTKNCNAGQSTPPGGGGGDVDPPNTGAPSGGGEVDPPSTGAPGGGEDVDPPETGAPGGGGMPKPPRRGGIGNPPHSGAPGGEK